MSAIVAQQVFAAGGNRIYLSLLGDEYVRQLSISNNWTRLHIGLLISIDYSTDLQGFDFRVGVCSYGNPTQGVYAWSTQNWIGSIFGTPVTIGSLTYNANAGVPYFTPANIAGINASNGKKIGKTYTAFAQGSPVYNFASNAGTTTPRRTILIVQITKGNTNYTISSNGSVSAAQAQTDYTFENLLEATQQINSVPGYVGATQLTGILGGSSGACSEATGIFDAISVAWHSRTAPLQIYGLAVYRVY